MLKDLKNAKADAEETIKVMPNWWKGYFRLGRAQMGFEDWKDAEKLFEKALALNPKSKESRDELSTVRARIGILTRQDYLDPMYQRSLSMDAQMAEACNRLGIGEDRKEQIKGIVKDVCEKNPKYANLLKATAYRAGDGVEKDLSKAAEFYEKAAAEGVPDAMYNLGKMYNYGEGVKRDFEKSMYWLLKAANSTSPVMINSGIVEAQHAIGLKYEEGAGVEKDYRKAAEWYEKAAKNGCGQSANNLGLLYRHGLGVEKSPTKAFHYFKHAITQCGSTAAMMNLADCYFDAAGTGSIVASDEDIAEGMKWLKTAAEKGDLRAAKEFEKRKNFNSEEEGASEFLNGMLMADINNPLNYEQYGKYVKERFKTHPNELDTVICYIHINTQNPRIVPIVQKYNKMFPDNIYLWEMVIANYMTFHENIEAALKTAKMTLKRHPTSQLMLYSHALLLQGILSNECVPAFDAFLAAAPEDDDKVPACHYRKAQYYITVCDFLDAMASIKAGKAAETKQLPCFLPYFFQSKPMLEKFFELQNSADSTSSAQGEPSLNSKFKQIESDPRRKMLILKHREFFIDLATAHTFLSYTVPNLPYKSDPPNWLSAKKITGKYMDSTTDKIYNGCVLEGRIIDWALLMASISTLFEDENGEVHRLSICNWPLPEAGDSAILEALKVFRPNVKISIINPFYKKTADGQKTIRVESPEFIKLDSSKIDKLCHVCGKEAKTLPSCSSCKMAKYCSKECQKLDWKEFDHKGICQYLKIV